MTVVVQPAINPITGDPQPMAYDDSTKEVIVDPYGYVIAGSPPYAYNPAGQLVGEAPITQTGGIKEAWDSGASDILILGDGTYNISQQIAGGTDVHFKIQKGAILKWTGAQPANNLAMFANSASISVVFDCDGTIDLNNTLAIFAVGFGLSSVDNPSLNANPSFPIHNSIIKISQVINVAQDAILCNNPANTDIILDAVVVAGNSQNGGDMVEIEGTRCNVKIVSNANNIINAAVTSSYLFDSTLDVKVLNSASPKDGIPNDVTLQAYTQTGFSAPNFGNIDIYATRCGVMLTNGNFTAGTIAGNNIRIHGREGYVAEVGDNGSTELWQNIVIDGQWKPVVISGGGGSAWAFSLFSYIGLTLNAEIDAINLVNTGLNGLIQCTSTNPSNQIMDYLNVKYLKIKNFASGNGYVLWGQNSSANKNQIGHILLGDIFLENVAGTFTNLALDSSSIISTTPSPATATISTNPPVSGTTYQNTNLNNIRLKIPITYNPTTTAAATLATGISPTSPPTTSTKVSIPAGLTAADGQILTYDIVIPAGWYYELVATNAVIGTAEVQTA